MAVPADTLPGMLSLSEADAQLGVTAGMLRVQAARGVLRAEKVGPMWVVAEEEVERYRREHLGKPGRRAHTDG